MGTGVSRRQVFDSKIPSVLANNLSGSSIESQIAAESKRRQFLMKILCLGASNSGKSTVLKQMRLIHLDGFSNEEKAVYRDAMLHSFVNSVHELLQKLPEDEAFGLRKVVDTLVNCTIQQLKNDKDFLDTTVSYLRSNTGKRLLTKLHKSEPCRDFISYFLNRIESVESFSELDPTTDDILRVRIQTTGVVYTQFNFKGAQFCMIDVGGQKSERRKWIHLFDDVKAIFYVVDISDFSTLNESLELFGDICRTESLRFASIILFFNKVDIFRQKDDLYKISQCFPEFKDTGSVADAGQFLKKLFEDQHKEISTQVYSFFTCATDTTNIDRTFGACTDIILKNSLTAAGLY